MALAPARLAKAKPAPGASKAAPAPAAGAKLPDGLRTRLEPRFGFDFGRVRIHTDSAAADALGARAFTVGEHIAFAPGEYRPLHAAGEHLLAHELAHVVQQSRGGPPAPAGGSIWLEGDARRAADAAMAGGTAQVQGAAAPGIARAPSEADLLGQELVAKGILPANLVAAPKQPDITWLGGKPSQELQDAAAVAAGQMARGEKVHFATPTPGLENLLLPESLRPKAAPKLVPRKPPAPPPAAVPDPFGPSGPTDQRRTMEQSPVGHVQDIMKQIGIAPEAQEGFRTQLLNTAPAEFKAIYPGIDAATYGALSDWAGAPLRDWRNFTALPPNVDALARRAGGLGPKDYVSQRQLDALAYRVSNDEQALRKESGLTGDDIAQLHRFFARTQRDAPVVDKDPVVAGMVPGMGGFIGRQSAFDAKQEEARQELAANTLENLRSSALSAMTYLGASAFTDDPQRLAAWAQLGANVEGVASSFAGIGEARDANRALGTPATLIPEGGPEPMRIGEAETFRNTEPLSDAQRARIEGHLGEYYPDAPYGFDEQGNTAYYPGGLDYLRIGPDVAPAPRDGPFNPANPANSQVSEAGALAHELTGHREASLAGQTRLEGFHEEAQASFRAALLAPGLTDAERWTLTQDAIARMRGQGDGTRFVWTEDVRPPAPPGPTHVTFDQETIDGMIGMWRQRALNEPDRSADFNRYITNLEHRRNLLLSNRAAGPGRSGEQSETEIQFLLQSRNKRVHTSTGTTIPDATMGTDWAAEVKNWNILYPTEAELEAGAHGQLPAKLHDLAAQVETRRERYGDRQTVVIDLRGQLTSKGATPAEAARNRELMQAFGQVVAGATKLPIAQIQIVTW